MPSQRSKFTNWLTVASYDERFTLVEAAHDLAAVIAKFALGDCLSHMVNCSTPCYSNETAISGELLGLALNVGDTSFWATCLLHQLSTTLRSNDLINFFFDHELADFSWATVKPCANWQTSCSDYI